MDSWKKMHSSAVESSSQSTEECNSQKVRVKEDTSAPNVREVTKCCVFSMIRVSGQSKSRPVKAAGAEVRCSEEKSKIARRCGEKHILQVKMYKTPSRFGALFEVQMSKNCTPLWRKAHSEVKMLKNWRVRDHFLKFRCRKIARRCGEKHIWKSKCTKHCMFGPLLDVQMSKNCTPLWRKAHLEVKM